MKFKKNGGFTLVELIVVIAILAILAGVAVPAYSGYINKANEAADQTLLSAVNTAYAAACLGEGKDMVSMNGATITVEDGYITKIVPYGETAESPFWLYYGENKNVQFKTIEKLVFDSTRKVICAPKDAYTISMSMNGVNVNVTPGQYQAIQDSTWNGMEPGAITGNLGNVSDLAAGLIGNKGLTTLVDAEYKNNIMAMFGYTDAMDFEDYAASIGKTPNELYANGLILGAAQATGSEDAATAITNMLKQENMENNFKTAIGKGTTEGLAEAAAIYAMYTSFAEAKGKTELAAGLADPDMNTIYGLIGNNQKEFNAYMKSDEGQADLQGYLAAMQVVGNSTGTSESDKAIISGGFAGNEQLEGVLGALMGGKS